MSATPSDRSGRFGRRSGPDAPRPVPFVKTLLPGVTFVNACKAIGQCVARLKKADDPATFAAIRQESDADRHAAILAYVRGIGTGKITAPTGERTIVTGKTGIGYSAHETADAILRAIAFLKKENPAQLDRYEDRIPGECD